VKLVKPRRKPEIGELLLLLHPFNRVEAIRYDGRSLPLEWWFISPRKMLPFVTNVLKAQDKEWYEREEPRSFRGASTWHDL
jgi:hypothetical protein